MPELPEVETTVRGLARVLDGERIERVEVRRPDMRRAFPEGLVQALTGATVTGLGRRAKYGLIHTDRGRSLVFHLGMSGRWRIDPSELEKHDHLVIETTTHRLALNDARRFGSVDLVDQAALDEWPAFKALGPEPLGERFTVEHLRAATKARKPAIKLLLLDQRVVGGLGNIYVCEALWRARIDPRKAGGKVSRPQLERLVPQIRAVLEQSIADGGSTLRDFAQPDGELGYFASRFDVYGREGGSYRAGAARGSARGVRSRGIPRVNLTIGTALRMSAPFRCLSAPFFARFVSIARAAGPSNRTRPKRHTWPIRRKPRSASAATNRAPPSMVRA